MDELKTYYAQPGCFDALVDRFRQHTLRIFNKLGIDCPAVWLSGEGEKRALVYLVRFEDEAARERKWQAFAEDEEWLAIKRESERPLGPLMQRQTSVLLTRLMPHED